MNLWLKELKKLVYDIDDLLDDVSIDDLRRSVSKSHFFPQLRYYFSSSNPLISRIHLSHKVKDVRLKLESIVAKKTKFDLTERPVEVSRPSKDLFNDISYVNRSSVVGRDGAKKQVMRKLLSVGDASRLSVLPIVGIGGIGKTTLAKLVYDDIRSEFDMNIWACVSDQFNLLKLLQDIVKGASDGVNTSNHTLGQLVNKVQDLLRCRKYMLVLDDVWVDDVAIWEELKSLLEVGKAGSVVLITTRSRQVASITQTMEEFNLDRLSDEISWSIFSQLVFREGEEQRNPFLCEIGRSIVEKCGGVPLVIKSLGSLLRRDRDEREWQRINNMDSFTKLPGEYTKVMQLLRISYDKLPSHLKTCFAYCSLKPRDVEFYATQLIYLWNAHGLLQLQDGNDDIEGCGFACAMELVSRSLLEHPSFIFNETMFTCKIHDLMHELAEGVLGEELAVVTRNDLNVSESTKLESLDVYGCETLEKLPKKIYRLVKLRNLSVTTCQKTLAGTCIMRLPCLRVLTLYTCKELELLWDDDDIGDLNSLRRLSIQQCQKLASLPNSMKGLTNLEDLVISNCEELDMEKGECMSGLQSLRSLAIVQLPLLKCLPDGVQSAANSLRHLCISNCGSLTGLGMWS